MQFTHRHVFQADVDRVCAMFADPEFATRRAAATPGGEGEAWVDGTSDGPFTVSIRRIVPATSIPAEFRSFVGKDLHVRYNEVWEAPSGDDRVGTFAVEIQGAPGHAAGAVGLSPVEGGTEFLATGEVKVTIPLFGSMVEKVVVDAVTKGLKQELASADAWLAQ
ncbi:DUF2505 domain-containing protein [Demequina sp.]|uniref:DUF2505 domain-containing protein n=1 Tax=Demequina sp. TaxID=2050685 RepID=UPI003D0BBC7C